VQCRIGDALIHYVERGDGVPLVALHGAGVDHREIEAALEVALEGTGTAAGCRRIYRIYRGWVARRRTA